jgi:hypothetical protein
VSRHYAPYPWANWTYDFILRWLQWDIHSAGTRNTPAAVSSPRRCFLFPKNVLLAVRHRFVEPSRH